MQDNLSIFIDLYQNILDESIQYIELHYKIDHLGTSIFQYLYLSFVHLGNFGMLYIDYYRIDWQDKQRMIHHWILVLRKGNLDIFDFLDYKLDFSDSTSIV